MGLINHMNSLKVEFYLAGRAQGEVRVKHLMHCHCFEDAVVSLETESSPHLKARTWGLSPITIGTENYANNTNEFESGFLPIPSR